MQEAKAASALQHNNICTVHEIGETDDGKLFIVMDYYDGETLEQTIARGPLDINRAIDFSIQITQGLREAHDHGIVHRDIKPANIFITGSGTVKALDFGLAKLSGRTQLTRTGATVGTTAYMSPEQAKGDIVDHRTDIWSLGIILYEMVAGRRPFRGEYEQAILYQTLNSEPDPIGTVRPDTPIALQEIIAKAMRKDPRERYQEIASMQAALQSLIGATPPGTSAQVPIRPPFWKRTWTFRTLVVASILALLAVAGVLLLSRRPAAIDSVALLPFANATNDSTIDYLCDGLTETLINRFARIPQLRVIARTTAFTYRGKDQNPEKVGRELHVGAVLTGKIVHRGDLLTVQVELVDTREGLQLWGERYNRKLRDLLTIQEEIAEQITNRLRLRLSGEEQQRLATPPTKDTEAYQLYLKGRYWTERLTKEGFDKALAFYNQAIAKDPSYALAYAGLADAYYWVSNLYLPPREAMEKSRVAAQRALDLDSQLGEAHLSLALVRMGYEFDWPGAETEFRRAIELNPGSAWAHLYLGRFLIWMGHHDEGSSEIQRAHQLDPLSPFIRNELCLAPFFMRRYDVAIGIVRTTLTLHPSFTFAHYVLGDQYVQTGDYASAIAEFQSAVASDDTPVFLAGLARAYAASGQRAKADSVVHVLSTRPYPPAYDIALIYVAMGKKDQAFEWLQQAYDDRNDGMIWLKGDPRVDPLRPEPRFKTLLRQLGVDN